jgi:hypothetical protein
MEVTLNPCLMADARLFQKVILNLSGVHFALGVKVDLNEFSEAGTVVVLKSFRISKRFQKGI